MIFFLILWLACFKWFLYLGYLEFILLWSLSAYFLCSVKGGRKKSLLWQPFHYNLVCSRTRPTFTFLLLLNINKAFCLYACLFVFFTQNCQFLITNEDDIAWINTLLLRRTCRTTVNSSRTWDVDISGLPTSTRVPCRGHSHRSATGVSL